MGAHTITANLHKGFTVIECRGRSATVHSADTIAQAGALMERTFFGRAHFVKFHVCPSAPVAVESQIKNRLAKLAKIARLAGFTVSRWDRSGDVVRVLVCK